MENYRTALTIHLKSFTVATMIHGLILATTEAMTALRPHCIPTAFKPDKLTKEGFSFWIPQLLRVVL
jgi:hypothetical protein